MPIYFHIKFPFPHAHQLVQPLIALIISFKTDSRGILPDMEPFIRAKEKPIVSNLMRILMDDDADGALAFLKTHFKGKARDLLEGG